MKTYTITILLFCINQLNAQQPLDTIYANDTKNVALFFPEPIRQGITGSGNFVFTYNREKEQYFGLLQATPGEESNLLVINNNGSVFSYILKYQEKISKLNYFVPTWSSIGNEKPTAIDSMVAEDSVKSYDLDNVDYQQFCFFLLERKQRIIRLKKQLNGIVLSVDNIVFDKEELYFVIQIENNSTLDYDLNFLDLSIETRQKGKRKSLQAIYKEPIYVEGLPSKIGAQKTARFVYVMSKFSLSNNRRVLLELNEKDGERNVELKINHRFINNPD